MHVFTSEQTQCKRKNIRINANTRQHLHSCTLFPQAPPHKHLHINPIKEKEKRKRELQLPCCASTHSTTASRLSCLSPLVPRASRASRASHLSCLSPVSHVRLSSTGASQARASLRNVRLPATCANVAFLSQFSSSSSALLPSTHTELSHVRLSSTCTSSQTPPSTLSCASRHVRLSSTPASYSLVSQARALHHSSRPALFWAHCIRVRQSGGHATPPPCLSSLRKQAEDEDLLRRSARAFWRETSPRPRRVSIRLAGSVTTRCTFDGECRWWCCVVVGEVASSRAWCMSVEYDVSVE